MSDLQIWQVERGNTCRLIPTHLGVKSRLSLDNREYGLCAIYIHDILTICREYDRLVIYIHGISWQQQFQFSNG